MSNIQPAVVKAAVAPATSIPAEIEARLAAVEATVKSDVESGVSKIEAWFKANWPHIITWVGMFGSTGLAIVKKLI